MKKKKAMKIEFNECIHFASLIPFLLSYDGKEEGYRCLRTQFYY